MTPCIFCGKPADSKEDLFPRWILKRVVTRQPLVRQIGDGPREITEDQEVRLLCVCQKCNNTWMSGMEKTVKTFLGLMIDDFQFPLDRQNQQTLTEWVVKCAMCNDTVQSHPRFFTGVECFTFKKRRTIPENTIVFAARFTGRSLDSNGADLLVRESVSGELLVRAYIYNLMVGHAVFQMLSWHLEPQHQDKGVRFKHADGPWDGLTIQIWPFEKNSVTWPPLMSLSNAMDVTHYGHFRARFEKATGHYLFPLKPKTPMASGRP